MGLVAPAVTQPLLPRPWWRAAAAIAEASTSARNPLVDLLRPCVVSYPNAYEPGMIVYYDEPVPEPPGVQRLREVCDSEGLEAGMC